MKPPNGAMVAVLTAGVMALWACSNAVAIPTATPPPPTPLPAVVLPSAFVSTPVPSRSPKWEFETGGVIDSSPAVVGGVAYIGSWDQHMYAVDVATGELRWRVETQGRVGSSPVVADGVVYFGSDDGHLYALDVDNGQEVWRFKTEGRVESSPAVADGTVLVGSEDKHLYALDSVTGAERWRFRTAAAAELDPEGAFDISGEALLNPRGLRSTPVVSRGVVYFASDDGTVYAVDLVSGAEKWQFPITERLYMTPAVTSDAVYLVDEGQGYLLGLDIETGELAFQFENSAPRVVYSSPVVQGDTAYLVTWNSVLHAIDLASTEKLWVFGGAAFAVEGIEAFADSLPSTPSVSDGVIYFGSEDGFLYALDSASGEELWRVRARDRVRSSPVVVDGVVYFGSHDGRLYAVPVSAPQQ